MKRLSIAILSLLMTGFCSCNHKELCYHHPHTAKVRVDVDWSRFTEESPTGMTVMVYPVDGGSPRTSLTHTLTHTYFNLQAGMYHTLVFNQSDSEFGSVEFHGMESYLEARVISATETARWYTARGDGSRVAAQPEWIAADVSEGGIVSEELVEKARQEGKHQGAQTTEYLLASHTPRNIVYTVDVRVHIKGVYNLRSARSALDGMAEGYRFAQASPTQTVATYLMESWTLTVNPADPTLGHIDGTLYCFGLPDGHTAKADDNEFLLSLLLVDNKTVLDFPFQVGDKFIRDADGTKLRLYLELNLEDPLPDVEPEGGSGSGFDATVEDWGEEIEHDIQM